MFFNFAGCIKAGFRVNLLRGNFSIFSGKRLDFMSGIFDCSGFMDMNMSRIGTDDTLPGTKQGGDYRIIHLRSANKKMKIGLRAIQIFFNFLCSAFPPAVQAVTAETVIIFSGERRENGRVGAVVVVIVKTNHNILPSFYYNIFMVNLPESQ